MSKKSQSQLRKMVRPSQVNTQASQQGIPPASSRLEITQPQLEGEISSTSHPTNTEEGEIDSVSDEKSVGSHHDKITETVDQDDEDDSLSSASESEQGQAAQLARLQKELLMAQMNFSELHKRKAETENLEHSSKKKTVAESKAITTLTVVSGDKAPVLTQLNHAELIRVKQFWIQQQATGRLGSYEAGIDQTLRKSVVESFLKLKEGLSPAQVAEMPLLQILDLCIKHVPVSSKVADIVNYEDRLKHLHLKFNSTTSDGAVAHLTYIRQVYEILQDSPVASTLDVDSKQLSSEQINQERAIVQLLLKHMERERDKNPESWAPCFREQIRSIKVGGQQGVDPVRYSDFRDRIYAVAETATAAHREVAQWPKAGGAASNYQRKETPKDSHVKAKTSSTEACIGCGRLHEAGTCRLATHPDFNKTTTSYKDTAKGKAYKALSSENRACIAKNFKKLNSDMTQIVAVTDAESSRIKQSLDSSKTGKSDCIYNMQEDSDSGLPETCNLNIDINYKSNIISNVNVLFDSGAFQGSYVTKSTVLRKNFDHSSRDF